MLNLKVDLGNRSYPIFIGNGILDKLGETFALYELASQVIVVTDNTVNALHGQALRASLNQHVDLLELISVPAGEKSKSFHTLETVLSKILETQADRDVAVIAFGGGVVGDLAGFAASIYKRGVSFVQAPTTLLAQVDSSVGGKTGINHALGKNLIGTFHQPKLVWMDLDLLKSLPAKEIRSGLGEIIKAGVIWDAEFFFKIEENLDAVLSLQEDLLAGIVQRSCEIKAEVVAKDERESNLRMILNFGHTVGHALEASLGYKNISHGEAVLAGMLTEAKIAVELGLLPVPEFEKLYRLIDRFEITPQLERASLQEVLGFMSSDKKMAKGRLRFVLPTAIGSVEIRDDVPGDQVESGVSWLLAGARL